jgi:hypothetical protein
MRSAIVILVVVAVVLGIAVWTTPPPVVLSPVESESAPRAAQAPLAPTPTEEAPAASAALSDPLLREHEERAAFHDRVRTFFAQAPALPLEEKRRTAQQLDALVELYERRRELSAAEALTLRLALIHETAPEAEQLERMQALRERYRARDDQRAQQASDPMFQLYKVREQEIVAHVQTLREIPGGLTREEYLRQRLQREREMLLEGTGNR